MARSSFGQPAEEADPVPRDARRRALSPFAGPTTPRAPRLAGPRPGRTAMRRGSRWRTSTRWTSPSAASAATAPCRTNEGPVVLAAHIVSRCRRSSAARSSRTIRRGHRRFDPRRDQAQRHPRRSRAATTVRTYKQEVRQKVLAAIQRVARGLAIAAGVPDDRMPIVSISETERGDALYNDPALTARLVKIGPAPSNRTASSKSRRRWSARTSATSGSTVRFLCCDSASAPSHGPRSQAQGERRPLPALHSAEFAPLPEPAIRSGIKATVLAVFELMSK